MTRSEIVSALRELSKQTPEGTEVLLPVLLYKNTAHCEANTADDREFEHFDTKFLLQFIADMME